MASWQWFGRMHGAVYRATGGVVGGRLPGLPILLLTTRGRKSGQLRTSPLPFLKDATDWVIVGSNNGLPRDPAWWLNLREETSAEIQVMGELIPVRARLAEAEQRERLWPALVKFNPRYAFYAERTSREIPIVVLTRTRAD